MACCNVFCIFLYLGEIISIWTYTWKGSCFNFPWSNFIFYVVGSVALFGGKIFCKHPLIWWISSFVVAKKIEFTNTWDFIHLYRLYLSKFLIMFSSWFFFLPVIFCCLFFSLILVRVVMSVASFFNEISSLNLLALLCVELSLV